jgi:hypothetical protein
MVRTYFGARNPFTIAAPYLDPSNVLEQGKSKSADS